MNARVRMGTVVVLLLLSTASNSFAQQADCKMGFLQMEASHFPEKSFHLKTDWPSDFSPEDIVEKSEDAVQIKSVYAKSLTKSPRPSLILKEAQAIIVFVRA